SAPALYAHPFTPPLVPRDRSVAGRPRAAPVPSRVRLGLLVSRHGARSARGELAHAGDAGCKPRSCHVVSPALPRRRVAALRRREPQRLGRPRARARTLLRSQRAAGGERCAGRLDSPPELTTSLLRPPSLLRPEEAVEAHVRRDGELDLRAVA